MMCPIFAIAAGGGPPNPPPNPPFPIAGGDPIDGGGDIAGGAPPNPDMPANTAALGCSIAGSCMTAALGCKAPAPAESSPERDAPGEDLGEATVTFASVSSLSAKPGMFLQRAPSTSIDKAAPGMGEGALDIDSGAWALDIALDIGSGMEALDIAAAMDASFGSPMTPTGTGPSMAARSESASRGSRHGREC
mmetsp:Transcript_73494/g.239133  ORF Transcript_73494/g.239133 Transcript_73494/m.239133 type:complete len:192 (-) Transcript_73494:8-583(-)